MTHYVLCPECNTIAATEIGGLGTKESPTQWECSQCGHVFLDNNPTDSR